MLLPEDGDRGKILIANSKGRYHSEELDVDGKIILEWILGK
jgi:hypothetical protein